MAGQGGQACMAGQGSQTGHVDTLGPEKNIPLGVVSLETILVLVFTVVHLFNKTMIAQSS